MTKPITDVTALVADNFVSVLDYLSRATQAAHGNSLPYLHDQVSQLQSAATCLLECLSDRIAMAAGDPPRPDATKRFDPDRLRELIVTGAQPYLAARLLSPTDYDLTAYDDTPILPRATLQDEVQHLLSTAISAALAREMSKIARKRAGNQIPPELHWTAAFDSLGHITRITGNVPSGADKHTVSDALLAWVHALRFNPTGHTYHGTLSYTALVDDLIVSLWGVTDHAEWENFVAYQPPPSSRKDTL